MPTVVEAYKAFKDKGFGIVGVSLDENADKWKEAITALNITWPQMSDLQGWNNALQINRFPVNQHALVRRQLQSTETQGIFSPVQHLSLIHI